MLEFYLLLDSSDQLERIGPLKYVHGSLTSGVFSENPWQNDLQWSEGYSQQSQLVLWHAVLDQFQSGDAVTSRKCNLQFIVKIGINFCLFT